jgi:hypothetical protein
VQLSVEAAGAAQLEECHGNSTAALKYQAAGIYDAYMLAAGGVVVPSPLLQQQQPSQQPVCTPGSSAR